MGTRFTLTRKQLQEFIPSHQAVLTFENLIRYVNDNSPEGIAIINKTLAALQTEIDSSNVQISSLVQIENEAAAGLSTATATARSALQLVNDLQLLVMRR